MLNFELIQKTEFEKELNEAELQKIDANNTNQGLTPIGLLGPADQHSFLQLIVEGKRDKTVTFIKIKDFKDDT